MDLAIQATGDWYSGCGSLEYCTETIFRAGELAERALADGPHDVLHRRIGRRNIASRQDVYKRLQQDTALTWTCDACGQPIADDDGLGHDPPPRRPQPQTPQLDEPAP
ncbi:MAG: hypothetical protein ACR2MN_02635 [Acidimicrobiales bacterium]